MSDPHSHSRRLLLRSALLAGGLIVAPALTAAGETPRPPPGPTPPSSLSAEQRKLLACVCDTILPQTDTPGALAAHVDEFIADTLDSWCSEPERSGFIRGLNELGKACLGATGRALTSLSAAERLAYLEPLDRQAAAARQGHVSPLPFFATAKELTLIGYYTSEVGCKAIGYAGPVGTGAGRDGPVTAPIWI
jgi:hypothetical protein